MNLQQIKQALAIGLPVHWMDDSHIVKPQGTQYPNDSRIAKNDLIVSLATGYAIGLTWADNKTLNGKESDFFIGECPQLQNFIDGYTECLLWSSMDENGENFEPFELSEAAIKKCKSDCLEFIVGNLLDLQEYATRYEPLSARPWECAGHDFWLTRNGHGAGFWDRGLGELGERLSKAAKVYGCVDPWLNDDKNEVEL